MVWDGHDERSALRRGGGGHWATLRTSGNGASRPLPCLRAKSVPYPVARNARLRRDPDRGGERRRRQELPQSGPCRRRKRPAQLGGYLPFRGIRSGDKGYVVSNPITPIRARQRRRAEIGHTLGPAPITALMR